MLHIINQGPSAQQLMACLRVAKKHDALILIENGVYLLHRRRQETYIQLQEAIQHQVICYVLLPDMLARGLEQPILSDIKTLSYPEFVDLTTEHKVIQSW